MHVASKILKSVLHNILVNCYVIMSVYPYLSWKKWKLSELKQQKEWRHFDSNLIFTESIQGRWQLWQNLKMLTDHTQFFAPKVRQISQNFSCKPFWLSITPNKNL